jgi:uridine phosphorylase
LLGVQETDLKSINLDKPKQVGTLGIHRPENIKMNHELYPILEFDPDTTAFLEPHKLLKPIDIARRCVLCFFQDILKQMHADGHLRVIHNLGSEIGHNPVYEMTVGAERIAVMHPGVGAPLAAGFLDELIALGCRDFIACGGCGVLDGEIGFGHVVVPATAVRDEGTSYHYLPPSREVAASLIAVQAIEQAMQAHHVPYIVGKTWTTDAFYRETPTRIARRRAEGCQVVEMEAAAFFAVAQFRAVTFGQMLYGGDDLTGDAWDGRNWQKESGTRARLFQLAIEACLLLYK